MDRQKFRGLTFKQKVWHIWEYYRWPILVAVVVITLLGSWIGSALMRKEPILEIEMINAYESTPGGEAFYPFLEAQGLEPYEDAVILDKNIQFLPGDGTPDLGSAQMLLCALASGTTDLYFWDSREIPPVLRGGPLMDLRQVLPEEVLEENRDLLVWDRDPETGEKIPVGIYMERNPWMMEQMYYVNCTVSAAVTAQDPELVGSLIRYLLNAK